MSPKRTAFTLVELLVVLGIIGILVAILIPAIQMAREASRRSQCANNLQNIAKGFLLHEQTNKFFPTGGWGWLWAGDADRGYDKTQPGGWAFNILPYIEEETTRNIGRTGSRGDSVKKREANLLRAAVPITLLTCPTRQRPAHFAYPFKYAAVNVAAAKTHVAKTDYAANAGSLAYPHALHNNNIGLLDAPDNAVEEALAFDTKNNGLSYPLSMVRQRGVSDGASKTYLVGERFLYLDGYQTGHVCDDDQSWDTSYNWNTFRWTTLPPERDTFLTQDRCNPIFGGPHATTFVMAMTDGSVQQLSYAISAKTHQAMGTRNLGEAATY